MKLPLEEAVSSFLDESAEKTALPDNPDMMAVERFVERVTWYAVTGELL